MFSLVRFRLLIGRDLGDGYSKMTSPVMPMSQRLPVPTVRGSGAEAFALATLAIIIVISIAASETYVRGAVTSATAAAILAPLIIRTAGRPLDIFEPIVPAVVALLVMFVGRPLADQVLGNYVHLGYDISAVFDRALLVSFVGCSAFSLGYVSGVGRGLQRFLPQPGARFSNRRTSITASVMAITGLFVFRSLPSFSRDSIRSC